MGCKDARMAASWDLKDMDLDTLSTKAPAGEGSLGGPGIAMPEPTADEVAAAAAEMASSFDQQASEMRDYWDQNVGRELKEKLWALAERRPAEPTKLMGQAFAGKKSLGEMASAPQTSDPNLKSAPPREFLNNTIVKDLAPALVQVYNKGSRRVVSDLGDILMKGK